jgi:Divergent InlB B-repeat domain
MKNIVKLIASILSMTILITSLTGCTPLLYSSCIPTGGGSVSATNGPYEKGVLVDVTATPNSGYRFDHWGGGASGKSPTIHLTMNSNKKLIAYFTKIYTLSVSCSPTVGGSVSPNNGVYDEKSHITLVASPNQSYQFSSWSGDVSGSLDHLILTMNSDKKITAIFVKSNIP